MTVIARSGNPPAADPLNVIPIHAHNYGPIKTDCPSDIVWLRPADSLGPDEQEYITKRSGHLATAWQAQTERVGLAAPPRTPVVAMALSGGGYRAMLSGSGMAFSPPGTEEGDVGDILGLSTYVSGLSGGSWAVTSYYANNATSPQDLVENVWHLEDHLAEAPFSKPGGFYGEYNNKKDADFETQMTDLWSLALADHLLPEPWRVDKTKLAFSDLNVTNPQVQQATLPYPLVVALERERDQPRNHSMATNSTIFEFTISEFGSWRFAGSQPGGFTPMRYLGTRLKEGKPQKKNKCVVGFDNAAFVLGTSSSLFNMFLPKVTEKFKETGEVENIESVDSKKLTDALKDGFDEMTDYVKKMVGKAAVEVLEKFGKDNDDVATYPNPFYKAETGEDIISSMKDITLVDGGIAGENVPLEPFLQPARRVDAIIAFDSSGDVNRWPSGESLYGTYMKARNHTELYKTPALMPKVPSTAGFIKHGLNSRPTFFGCNDKELPLVIYIPNYPYIHKSNTDTFKLDYSKEDALGIVENGRRVLNLNGTISKWPQCLTCALMDNAVMQQKDATRSAECQKCFDAFCWNGEDDQGEPATDYDPQVGAPSAFLASLSAKLA